MLFILTTPSAALDFSCRTTQGLPYAGKTSVFGWGSNARTQISFSTRSDRSPVKINVGTRSVNVTKIVGGLLHTALLDSVTGNVWLNGMADSGQLGAGPHSSPFRNEVLPIPFTIEDVEPIPFTRSVFDVACGMGFTCVVTTASKLNQGAVYCAGVNDRFQLGRSSPSTKSHYFMPVDTTGAFGSQSIVAVAAGSDHVAALTSDGTVWTWGSNSEGALGNGQNVDSYAPVKVIGIVGTVVKISCGLGYCAAQTASGVLFGWGQNAQFQLGGASNASFQLTAIRIVSQVSNFVCGGAHVLAIIQGRLYSWGAGTMGATGQASPLPSGVAERWYVKTPTLVTALADVNVVSIAAGSKHSIVLDACGTVYTFGSDAEGQLGLGSSTSNRKSLFRQMLPVVVADLQRRGVGIVAVYAGWFNSYAVTIETTR